MIAFLLAAQLSIVTNVPDSASTCAPFDITVAARMRGGAAPAISPLSSTTGFQLLKSREASRIEHDGTGSFAGLTEVTYTIAAANAGRLAIAPFTASVTGAHASTPPASVEVRSSVTSTPFVVVRAWLERLSAHGAMPADTLVVGEQVDYVVDVHLNDAARQRLRRNPTFFPPEMPGVLAYDLATPSRITQGGQRCFETLSYRRALFPLFAGRSVIAPAALTYSLPVSSSFFSREESFELRTDSVRFVSVEMPAEGRPTPFSGAVGTLSAETRLSTQSARMGDPVVLTLRLQGGGNVKLWPRPPLAINWGAVTPGPERVEVDTSTARVRGAKEFDWVLTPRQAGKREVPGLTYSYFDPERKAYGSSSAAPLALDVVAASLAVIDSTPTARLSIRRTMSADASLPVSQQPWYWALIAGAPLPALYQLLTRKRSTRRERRSAMRRLQEAAPSSAPASVSEVRRLFLDAVAERVPATRGETRSRSFGRTLRLAGVSTVVADRAEELFNQLDVASFAGSDHSRRELNDDVLSVANAIDREALRREAVGRATMLVFLIIGAAGTIMALEGTVQTIFHQGVVAYDHAAYPLARATFARVLDRKPRSVDAWANLASSAYASGDTASAVRGWERALRLDPLDDDVRDRLQLVQPVAITSVAYVPPLSPMLIGVLALTAWYFAWLGIAFRKRLAVPTYPRSAFVTALALFAVTLATTRRSRTDSLAVMRVSRMLLDAPSSSISTSTAVVGETGVMQAREGVWVFLKLDASRSGWLPLAAVLPLDAPAND